MDFFVLLCHNNRPRAVFTTSSLLFSCILSYLATDSSIHLAFGVSNLGINYGRVADNLPQPSAVVALLQSISVTQTRIYDADATVLQAFANSGISIIVGIGNENIASLTNPSYAANWVQANVAAYYPSTAIAGIAVGNEVLTGNDTQLMSDLTPAIQNLYSALSSSGLANKIWVSTAHSLAILSSSYPPSAGQFVSSQYLTQLLQFLDTAQSPFLINAYPYFAYKASPNEVSLQYVLFESTDSETANSAATVTDPSTGLVYHNMFDAQVDAIYAALQASSHADLNLIVSETGWPWAGDSDEPGASVQNAQAYNTNLINHLALGQGTPAHPSKPIKAFIFALFNEDQKPGPSSERHYGLYNADGTRVYDFGLDSPRAYTIYSSLYSSGTSAGTLYPNFSLLILVLIFLFFINLTHRQNLRAY